MQAEDTKDQINEGNATFYKVADFELILSEEIRAILIKKQWQIGNYQSIILGNKSYQR